MVSLFSLYKTKWQKLPRFLGQKCFRGAFKDTENKEIYSTEQKMLGENLFIYSKIQNLDRLSAVSYIVQ